MEDRLKDIRIRYGKVCDSSGTAPRADSRLVSALESVLSGGGNVSKTSPDKHHCNNDEHHKSGSVTDISASPISFRSDHSMHAEEATVLPEQRRQSEKPLDAAQSQHRIESMLSNPALHKSSRELDKAFADVLRRAQQAQHTARNFASVATQGAHLDVIGGSSPLSNEQDERRIKLQRLVEGLKARRAAEIESALRIRSTLHEHLYQTNPSLSLISEAALDRTAGRHGIDAAQSYVDAASVQRPQQGMETIRHSAAVCQSVSITITVPHLLQHGPVLFPKLSSVTTTMTVDSPTQVLNITGRQMALRALEAVRRDIIEPALRRLHLIDENPALIAYRLPAVRAELTTWVSASALETLYDRRAVVVLCSTQSLHCGVNLKLPDEQMPCDEGTRTSSYYDGTESQRNNQQHAADGCAVVAVPLCGEVPLAALRQFRYWHAVTCELSLKSHANTAEKASCELPSLSLFVVPLRPATTDADMLAVNVGLADSSGFAATAPRWPHSRPLASPGDLLFTPDTLID